MAACKELVVNEEYLTCNICLELYDKPRTLPCLHSFCHECLVGYAGKCLEKTGTTKLYCPICRASTLLDRKLEGNVAKWVESLPLNFTLVSILSSENNKMSESSYGSKCDQCLRENIEKQAIVYCYECSEKLCEKCQEIHKKVKFTSNHRLCDIENKQDIAKLELLKSLTKCPEHLSEEVRYICKDHDQLCCNECAIVSHRKCNCMMSLAKEQVEINKSTEDTGDHLKEIIVYLEELAAYEVKHQSTIGDCKRELTDKLKCIKKQIDDIFQVMYDKISKEFDEKSSTMLKESEMQKEQIESLKCEVEFSLAKMETAKEFGQPIHMFVMQKILMDELQKHEKEMHCLFEKSSAQIVQADEQTVCEEIMKNISVCLRIVTKNSRSVIPQCPNKFSSTKNSISVIPQCPNKFSSKKPKKILAWAAPMPAKETSNIVQDDIRTSETGFVESCEPYLFEDYLADYDTESDEQYIPEEEPEDYGEDYCKFQDRSKIFCVPVSRRNKTTKIKIEKYRKLLTKF